MILKELLSLTFAALACAWAPTLVLAVQPDDQRVQMSAVAQRPRAHAGDQFAAAVVLDYANGWHSWPHVPVVPKELAGLEAWPTTLALSDAGAPKGLGVHVEWAQWPAAHEERVAGTRLMAYSGREVVYVPIVVLADAAHGSYEIPLRLSYQPCDANTCEAPTDADATLRFEVVARDTPVADEGPDLFAGFLPDVFGKVLSGFGPREGWEFDFVGVKFTVAKDAFALILGIAFVAGVLMNFTPCVLPVIPIKILSLQSHAGSRSRLAALGIAYCLGVVLLYAILGLLAFGLVTGGRRFDWGQLFSLPWFTIAMSVVVAAMGLGMALGLSVRLPRFVYLVNPTGDTVTGNVVGGLLTGVLATPCTGPLLGASFAWAVTQPPALGLLAITVMGAGMAAPYAMLIAFPRLLDRVPRGGPGGELLKQVLGVFMLAVAAYLAGNLTESKWPWWAVGGVCMAGGLWLVVGAWRRLRSRSAKVVCTVVGLASLPLFGWGAATLADEGPLSWRLFRNRPDAAITAAIGGAVADGKVVVADFTAKWCANCQVIEKTVLNSTEGVALLTSRDVVLLKVDLGNAGPAEGWGVVHEIAGGGGIPLIAVFGPAVKGPIYFQSFFPIADLRAAVEKARGAVK